MNISIKSLLVIIATVNLILVTLVIFNVNELDKNTTQLRELQFNEHKYSTDILYSKKSQYLNNKITTNIEKIFLLIFIGLVVFIVSFLIAIFKIFIPIESLTKFIKLYKNDKTNFDKKIYYNDEIGLMTKQFFSMKSHLDKKYSLIEKIVITDELTNVYNRKHYNEKISESLSLYKRYKTIFSILMYDIDDFKNINDTYGHSIGDKVLVDMSKLVKSMLRDNDYIFRVGGEEFIVLLSETNLEASTLVAEKIRKKISQLKTIKNESITVSIGLTQVQKKDTEDLIYKRVDKLLYISKEKGKNRVSI